ncbi:hypothetical protein HK414_12970 [Ramlibacter terrae]|uniref:Winged helix-turn-helix domain-containing protein n=1 Tax=Ramlibacter terrae TaxID=2732511 RepID=A0ABX6P2R5_9BURK|nr:hypothetical protein HK414_12970 [Ramlibacter terrae]
MLADVRAIRSRGTATEVQEDRMLAALRAGPKSTDDFRKLGIYQSSARIWGLRQRGYIIETELFDGFAADGYSHARMARYTLKEEPLALDASMARQAPQQPAQGQQGGEVACN